MNSLRTAVLSILLTSCGDDEKCSATTSDDGTVVLSCPGADPVVVRQGSVVPGCTAASTGEDALTITCPGSAPFVVRSGKDGSNGMDGANGTNGADGVSCTAGDNGDGTVSIRCPGSPTITVSSTVSASCVVVTNPDNTHTLSCRDSPDVIIDDGCEVTDDGIGTVTIACAGSTPVTLTQVPGSPVGVPCPLAPNSFCMNVDLSEFWLAALDLRGVNFSRSTMLDTVFDRANLDGAMFYRARLRGTLFRDASLVGSNFVEATGTYSPNPVFADFSGANLRAADLSRAGLPGANFSAADLTATTMRGMNVGGHASTFDGATLNGADLSGANLEFASFQDSDLSNADLRGVQTNSATSFRNANLTCAWLDESLTGREIDFSGATCPDGALADAAGGCSGKLSRGSACP